MTETPPILLHRVEGTTPPSAPPVPPAPIDGIATRRSSGTFNRKQVEFTLVAACSFNRKQVRKLMVGGTGGTGRNSIASQNCTTNPDFCHANQARITTCDFSFGLGSG